VGAGDTVTHIKYQTGETDLAGNLGAVNSKTAKDTFLDTVYGKESWPRAGVGDSHVNSWVAGTDGDWPEQIRSDREVSNSVGVPAIKSTQLDACTVPWHLLTYSYLFSGNSQLGAPNKLYGPAERDFHDSSISLESTVINADDNWFLFEGRACQRRPGLKTT
jgi:hypothetical protein